MRWQIKDSIRNQDQAQRTTLRHKSAKDDNFTLQKTSFRNREPIKTKTSKRASHFLQFNEREREGAHTAAKPRSGQKITLHHKSAKDDNFTMQKDIFSHQGANTNENKQKGISFSSIQREREREGAYAAATMPEADAQGREQDGDEDFAEDRAPARHCDSLLCR